MTERRFDQIDEELLWPPNGVDAAVRAEYPCTVAVVDDDRSILRLVELYLRRDGFGVMTAGSIREARAILYTRDWDILLLERNLPDGDGAELCHEMRQESELADRFMILFSAAADPDERARGLDRGADDYVAKPFLLSELMARLRSGRRIVNLQKALAEANRRLRRLSVTDDLTGIFNRRHFRFELSRAVGHAVRYDRPLSLALIDIDRFKRVNDSLGHEAGDEVLRKLARVLSSCTRSTDVLARVGGDEFAVVLAETGFDDALRFGEKIREAVERSKFRSAGELQVTVSIGIASHPLTRVGSAYDLLNAADKALYRAKRGGRNRVEAERRQGERTGDDGHPRIGTN